MKRSGVFFNKFATQFDTFYDSQRSPFMQFIDAKFRSDMFIRFQMTFELIGDLKGKSVLDIGCGTGPYVAESFRLGANKVIGIDPAPNMIELARQRINKLGYSNQVNFLQGYFPQVSPNESLDFGIIMGVMDYIEDVKPFLLRIKKVVSKKAIISFPSIHWLRTPVRKCRYFFRNCPVFFYNEEKIAALITSVDYTDFEIKKIDGAGMDYVVWVKI